MAVSRTISKDPSSNRPSVGERQQDYCVLCSCWSTFLCGHSCLPIVQEELDRRRDHHAKTTATATAIIIRSDWYTHAPTTSELWRERHVRCIFHCVVALYNCSLSPKTFSSRNNITHTPFAIGQLIQFGVGVIAMSESSRVKLIRHSCYAAT